MQDGVKTVKGQGMRVSGWVFGLALAGAAAQAHEADLDAHIRAYILNHPEIILEAMELLAAREKTEAVAAQVAEHSYFFTDDPRLGMGAPDAPVRVVEFFDYRCAPCKAMHPELNALVDETPDLRIEMRQLPILSPGSERAARFALAVYEVAGADAYARVHEKLWALKGPLRAVSFEKIAAEEGLDYATLEPVMEGDAVSTRIDTNRVAAIALGILGTPGFVTPSDVSYGGGEIEDLAARWLSR